MFFIQHSCLIHMDQLSLSRAAAQENVLHLKNELWKQAPQTAGFSCPRWISMQWRCWRHKSIWISDFLVGAFPFFVAVWSTTALCMSVWIPENWWMLQRNGGNPVICWHQTSQDVFGALLTVLFMSGQLGRPYGAEKHSFSSKEILKPSSVWLWAKVNPVCVCYSPGMFHNYLPLPGGKKWKTSHWL